jgi:G3E family GTPase
VATTVDAVNGRRQIDENTEAVKQAALAGGRLLTKTDLVAADELAELDRKLKALNPGATRKIAPDEIFGTALFDPARKTTMSAAGEMRAPTRGTRTASTRPARTQRTSARPRRARPHRRHP